MTILLTRARISKNDPEIRKMAILLTHARTPHTPRVCQKAPRGGVCARACKCKSKCGSKCKKAVAPEEQDSRRMPPPALATILRHCRCCDCKKFVRSFTKGNHCLEGIGGEKVVWATGEHILDPLPDAWHYCAGYDGPQLSSDVWIWPRGQSGQSLNASSSEASPADSPTPATSNSQTGTEPTHHVCAGAKMSDEVEQNYDQLNMEILSQSSMVPPPQNKSRDRAGNGRQQNHIRSVVKKCITSKEK